MARSTLLIGLLLLFTPSFGHTQPEPQPKSATQVAMKGEAGLPAGFVRLEVLDPSIRFEMAYPTSRNFTGGIVPGYERPSCIVTSQAAQALKRVQTRLRRLERTLVIFDCYRPARAVTSFVNWAGTRGPSDPLYYPTVPRHRLIQEGYIGSQSTHSRGSTVDLAIGPLRVPDNVPPRSSACGSRMDAQTFDFGTPFDCFDPQSGASARGLSRGVSTNRRALTQIMRAEGFKSYSAEWWHFTYESEPYPGTRFDFLVR